MASKTTTKPHLFLSLNLLYFILSATSAATSDPPSASPPLKPPTGGSITVPIGNGGSVTVTNPRNGGSSVTVTNPPNNGGGGAASPIGSGGGGGSRTGKCPRDAVKLGVCANVVGDLVKVVVGDPPAAACCSLVAGLVDLEAAVCLCTVVRATVAGIDVGTPLNLLLDACGRTPPIGFTC